MDTHTLSLSLSLPQSPTLALSSVTLTTGVTIFGRWISLFVSPYTSPLHLHVLRVCVCVCVRVCVRVCVCVCVCVSEKGKRRNKRAGVEIEEERKV